jgi:hypothetical protein
MELPVTTPVDGEMSPLTLLPPHLEQLANDTIRAPILFVAWLKMHTDEMQALAHSIDENQKDLDVLVTQFTAMKTNVNSLKLDLDFHWERGDTDLHDVRGRVVECEQMMDQVMKVKQDMLERRNKVMKQEFPKLLDELNAGIETWQMKERSKYRSMAVLALLLLIAIFVATKILWWLLSVLIWMVWK